MANPKPSKITKIAVVTCYKQNDYPRAVVLRQAFAAQPGVEVTVIKNERKDILRYVEVFWKVLVARVRLRPDVYVITFRGYELLLYVVLSLVRKPIIFDELINFEEWMYENERLTPGSRPSRWLKRFYAWLLRHCRVILADTDEHARHSAELSGIPLERYRTIPVSTVESSITSSQPLPSTKNEPFIVFYPNYMRRLHGTEYVLQAAVSLADNPNIQFVLSGGKEKARAACAEAAAQGAHVVHHDWIPFDDMAGFSRRGLTLGGPFGNTTQAQYVITGKTYNCLAAGFPVLIGKNKVKSELKDKQNCLIVPQANAAAIAEAVRWAATHPKELRAIGQAGRKLYQEHYSQAIVATKVGAIVEELRA